MSLFLDPADILKKNDDLNYINYENINEEQKEFLRSDLWDFEFITPPAAVYFPGNALLRKRTMSVAPNLPGSLGDISATVRGFTISQKVGITTNGSVSIDYNDREDQAISMFLYDWKQKLTDNDTKFTYRKEDTYAVGLLTMYNSSRVAIRKYKLLTCQLDDGSLPGQFTSDEPSNNGSITMTLKYEHYRVIWENLPA